MVLILQCYTIARFAVWCSIFPQVESDSGSVVAAAKFEAGMSTAYALGWNPSIKCKFLLENLRSRGKWLEKARIKDTVLGTDRGVFLAKASSLVEDTVLGAKPPAVSLLLRTFLKLLSIFQ